MKHFKLAILFVLLVVSVCANSVFAQKIKAEDIIAEHLNSIGTAEIRSSIKNQIIFSDVQVAVKGVPGMIGGKAVILSSGEKNFWGMNFNSNAYPQDRFGYNGKETKVGFSTPGARSFLGEFIFLYRELLKEGLLGGTLSSSWALLNTNLKKPKLSYEGTKKIGEKEAHVLSYSPKNGSDLSIKMFFDAKDYQHIRTEYDRVIAARQGPTVDGSAGQGADRFRLIEEFSDFKKAGNLTLPSTYKIFYSYSSNSSIQLKRDANREVEWKFKVTNYSYNQKLDESSFNIDAK